MLMYFYINIKNLDRFQLVYKGKVFGEPARLKLQNFPIRINDISHRNAIGKDGKDERYINMILRIKTKKRK